MAPARAARLVARITVEGMIVSGEGGGVSPYGMEDSFANAGDISAAIMDAAEDKNVKAILIRINSPGGTPSASETIYRSIVRAQTTYKKPVFVSMGGVAASGGYWIAAPADKIYALDGTLTGSIGVVGGKFDASGLWEKLDVNWESDLLRSERRHVVVQPDLSLRLSRSVLKHRSIASMRPLSNV